MAKLIAYPLSVLYYLLFGCILILFDAIQRICYFVFGFKAHRASIIVLSYFLLRCLNILGTRFVFECPFILEKTSRIFLWPTTKAPMTSHPLYGICEKPIQGLWVKRVGQRDSEYFV